MLDGALKESIDTIFSEWDSTVSPGCALGIYLDDEIAYSRGYGMSNLEHGVPIRPDSIFHVASISKQFAAHCIVLLAQEGALSLADDIRTYLPDLPDYGDVITIQHLIHHTSGLRDQWELLRLAGWRDDDLITDDDVLEIAVRQKALNFKPSEQYFYSNTGYTFLGLIIKRVSGKSLRQFADERIFQPLGMTRTHFHNNHSEIVPGRTQAYQPGDSGDGYRISIPVFDTTGATSLHTTVEDLFRWHQYLQGWLAETDNAPYMQLAVLTAGDQLDYGCGLRHSEQHGVKTVGHSGADAGYRAHFITMPEHGLGISVLCNLSTMAPARLVSEVLAMVVEQRLGGTPDPDPTVIELPADELAGRAGIYRGLRTGAVIEIAAAEGGLTLPLMGDLQLEPVSSERFVNRQAMGLKLHFRTPVDSASMLVEVGELDSFERIAERAWEPADLAAYAGRFYSAELDVNYEIFVEEGALYWKQRRFEPRQLQPATPDTFVSSGRWIEFVRDAEGQETGFTISSLRARRMRFERLPKG